MTIETHVDRALGCVERERSHVGGESRASERFRSDVAALSPRSSTTRSAGQPVGGGSLSVSGWQRSDQTGTDARRVRESLSETVRPHRVADFGVEEPLLETVRAELGESVAFASAPAVSVSGPSDASRSQLTRRCASLNFRLFDAYRRLFGGLDDSVPGARQGDRGKNRSAEATATGDDF